MTSFDPSALLDPPAFPEGGFATVADRLKGLVGTGNDVVFVEAEAVVALEAAAASLARPGLRALNVVTSPYGALFGAWLRRGGAEAHDLRPAVAAAPIAVDEVERALADIGRVDMVSLVHAESASGILNPLEAIADLVRASGALLVVDAVASAGGHALAVDDLGIDVVALGPQKAFAGPAGLSALALSPRAWEAIDRPDAPRHSMLSLVDRRRDWLQAGRGVLPGTPVPLEWHAFAAALDRVEAEGIDRTIARHRAAAAATRHGLADLGLTVWPASGAGSGLVTCARLPDGIDRTALLAGLAGTGIDAAVGPGTERLVRLNHTGRRADPEIVAAMLAALATALAALC